MENCGSEKRLRSSKQATFWYVHASIHSCGATQFAPEYAAAFFLLGGSLKDAVNVCLNKLNDFQLAIALSRVVEGTDDGPILQGILRTTVVPLAFKDGNRWLASWAFWLLHRRDLAVRILVVCYFAQTQCKS